MSKLVIRVIEIIGNCLVYKFGDKIIIDVGYKLNVKETDTICMHSLSSLVPYCVALSKGTSSNSLGLSKKEVKNSTFYV